MALRVCWSAGSDNVYIIRRALFAPHDAFHKDQDDDVSGSLLATSWEVPADVRILA